MWHMMSQICKNYANFVQILKNSFGVFVYKEAEYIFFFENHKVFVT